MPTCPVARDWLELILYTFFQLENIEFNFLMPFYIFEIEDVKTM
jgi:hypothetical protein